MKFAIWKVSFWIIDHFSFENFLVESGWLVLVFVNQVKLYACYYLLVDMNGASSAFQNKLC